MSYDEIAGGVTEEAPAVVVDPGELDYSWVRYGFGMPVGGTLNSISLTVPAVSGEFWVGLSDYGGKDTWEWYGPYDSNAEIVPSGAPEQYLSESGNLYWVVLAVNGNSFTLASSTVDYDYEAPVLYHVPPPGVQTVTTEASYAPSLVRLPATEGISEDGAPLIFYTSGDGLSVDSYVAHYDGAQWVSEPLFADGPQVLMAIARLRPDTTQLVVAACNVDTGEVTLSTLSPELEVITTQPVGNDPTGTLTALAMDCLDSSIWCVAQARRSGDGAAVGASYDDLTEHLKLPYSVDLPGEEVAGLDVTYEQTSPGVYSPVVAYSHGTIDTTDAILLDFSVTLARPMWETSETDHNSPLTLDLGTDSDGNLTMLMVSGRDFQIPLTSTYVTLYYDAVLGTLSGDEWTYEDIYTSTVNIHIFESNIAIAMAGDVSWAGSDALSFANLTGTIEFSAEGGFHITGGDIQNETKYYTKSGDSWGDSSYFTGTPGVQLSWQDGPGGPACAYIKAETIDVNELLGGNLNISSELRYWSPGA